LTGGRVYQPLEPCRPACQDEVPRLVRLPDSFHFDDSLFGQDLRLSRPHRRRLVRPAPPPRQVGNQGALSHHQRTLQRRANIDGRITELLEKQDAARSKLLGWVRKYDAVLCPVAGKPSQPINFGTSAPRQDRSCGLNTGAPDDTMLQSTEVAGPAQTEVDAKSCAY